VVVVVVVLLLIRVGNNGGPLSAAAYKYGDVIQISVSSSSSGQTSIGGWKELNLVSSPHFCINDQVLLLLAFHAEEKISFHFGQQQQRLMTPWISLQESNTYYLDTLHFLFSYSGDEIIELDWHAQYKSRAEQPEEDVVKVVYEWIQFVEKDEVGGLATLMVSSFSISFFLFIYIISSSSSTTQLMSRHLPIRAPGRINQEIPHQRRSQPQTVQSQTQLPPQQIQPFDQPQKQVFSMPPTNLQPPVFDQQQPSHQHQVTSREEQLLEPFSEEEISSFVGGVGGTDIDLVDTIPQSTEGKEE